MIDMPLGQTPYTPTAGRAVLRFDASGNLIVRKSNGSDSNLTIGSKYGVIAPDIASASTTDLSTVDGDYVQVTGTATINSLGTVSAGALFTLVFTGAGQVTHNGTSLILPGGTSITRAAGDVAMFRSLGSGNWRCVNFSKAPIVTTLPQNIAFTGVITPGFFASQQNDYNPSGLATASVLRLQGSGNQNITGIQGGSSGRILVLYNIGTSVLTLKDDDASSSAANRFQLASDLNMPGDSAVTIQYDSTSSRWRLIGTSGVDTNTSVSVDNELVLFSGTTGKQLKRATGSGYAKLTSGVMSVAAQINLASEVSGDLPFANLAQGSALSVLGIAGNATADFAPISAASDFQVFRRSGTTLAFGAINLAQSAAVTGSLPTGNGGTGLASPGANGNVLMSNGTIWTTVAGSRRIAEIHGPNSTDSNVAETVWSFTIPTGTLAADGYILQFSFGGRMNKNANTKTIRVKFAGATFWDGGAITTATGGGFDFYIVNGFILRAFNNSTYGAVYITVGESTTVVPLRCQTRTNSDGGSFGNWDSTVAFAVELNSSAANGGPGDVQFDWGWMSTGPNA